MATNKELAGLMGSLDTAGKTNAEIVVDAYDALFGRTPDTDGMNYWTGRLDDGLSTDDLQAALLGGARQYSGTFAAEAIADLAMISSKNAVADALIEAGVSGTEAADYLATVTDATSRDSVLAAIAVAHPPVVDPTDPTDPTDPVDAVTASLDTKSNNETGSNNADMFYAFVQQNEAGTGTLANALSTADSIDGKGGHDILDATMINDQKTPATDDFAPMPVITNVEEIRIQSLDKSDTPLATDFDQDVVLDADRITLEDLYASDRSRGDLTVTNVNLDDDQVTESITIEMKDTQQNSDMAVYFNEQDLIKEAAGATKNAQFFIQVADGNAQDTAKPLDNIKFDLDFTQEGTTHTFTNLSAVDGTYTGLVASIEAALAEKGLTGYTVALGDDFTTFETTGTNPQTFNLDYTGKFVTVTDDAGVAFETINFTPSQKSGTTLAIILAQSDVDNETIAGTSYVESTIILDNVGRGSNGGELVVGSTSNSDSSTGIEIINITVENSSVLHDISTTNTDNTSWNGLQEITLTNGEVKGDFTLTNATYNSLKFGMYNNVGDGVNSSFITELDKITATDFDGAINLGRDNAIVNLGTLSANVNGDVTLDAKYDGGAGIGDPAALDSASQAFVVVTGAGDDTITAAVSGESSSGSTDTSLTVSAGNGNNKVTLSSDAVEKTVAKVTTGTGADEVTGGMTHLEVNTGAGNDVIYAENTGLKTEAQIAATVAAATYGNTVTTTTNLTAINGVDFLNNRDVQVTLALPNGTNTAAGYTDGLEVIANVKASDGLLTTERDVYNAVAKAINDDAVLNKLASAEVLSTGNLVVTYKIDGVTVATTDAIVDMTVLSDAATDLTTAEAASLLDAVQEAYGDSEIDAADITAAYDSITSASDSIVVTANNGLNSSVNGGLNVVNGGLGDDVIVLSSDATATWIDTIEFDAGNFGNDTIVHFTDGAAGDVLDFTAWMNNKENLTTSTSVDSQTDIAVTYAAVAGAIVANQVTVVDFSAVQTAGTFGAAITFDNMTDAQVLSALTTAGAFTVGAANAGLVGTTQNSLLIIQDKGDLNAGVQNNEGEYKVYEVVSDNLAGEGFTSATLVGSVDFGVEQTFHVDNF